MIDNMDGGRLQSRRPATDRHEGDLLALINWLLLEAAYLDRELLLVAEPRRPEVTHGR
jgi:hypothetical protein